MHAQAPTLVLAPPRDSVQHEFTRVSSVRELSNGQLLIVDSRDRTLLVAHPRSGSVRPLGRTGRGPAEYERPTRLVALGGDSTLLLDPGTRRWLLLVGPRIVGTLTPSDSVVARAGTAIFGADRAGHVISTALINREDIGADRQRDRLAVRRTNRWTARTDTLLVLQGTEWNVEVHSAGGAVRRDYIELEMSVPEQVLLFPDGWLAIARQRPYRVDWRAPSGDSVSGAPLPWTNPPVGPEEKEIHRRWIEEQTGRPFPGPITFAFAGAVPPFATQALHALPNGALLVARAKWSGSRGTEYDVVDRRGRLAGVVLLPENVRIVGAGMQHVFTVATDDDGIETIRRHPWSW